jgi:hypothetical protein
MAITLLLGGTPFASKNSTVARILSYVKPVPPAAIVFVVADAFNALMTI